MPLTAAQIVTDACQIAKCPGYTAQAGRALNLTLADLVMHRNLKVNLITQSLILQPASNGPWNLEANYLRTYDLWFNLNGEPYFLNPSSLREFDSEVQQAALESYPYEWATDLSPVGSGGVGLLYTYPQANTQLTLTHRYYTSQADIVNPATSATVPWFSDQDYLIHMTACRLMKITDDDRYAEFVANGEQLLLKHLMTEGDEQQVVKSVQLDPRRFKVGGGNRPTKLDPW
ncbi:MAG: hypothetical protein B7X10_03370 [Burkholderiales bacterium 21-58-4]|nr:MAG: hypothetical protein B7X10_03370 [Burkholderiales bacterium 21-58-4]